MDDDGIEKRLIRAVGHASYGNVYVASAMDPGVEDDPREVLESAASSYRLAAAQVEQVLKEIPEKPANVISMERKK